jgi:hypothetical protein
MQLAGANKVIALSMCRCASSCLLAGALCRNGIWRLFLSSGGGKTIGTDGNIRMLESNRIAHGMPTFVYHVLREAAWTASVTGCGRPWRRKVPQGLRRKLECASNVGAQNINVISTYGFTEAKINGANVCSGGRRAVGHHLYPDLNIVEIIDPETGALKDDGQPEIDFTSLTPGVMFFAIGPALSSGRPTNCPHCRRLTRAWLAGYLSGHPEMQLDKVKGTLVDFNELEHVSG